MKSQTDFTPVVFIGDEPRPITAYLVEATRTQQGDRTLLSGRIYGDRRGHFPDGMQIHTSFISKELGKDRFLTLSDDLYQVASWA